MIQLNQRKLFSNLKTFTMKELIKPNTVEDDQQIVNTHCGEQKIDSCGKLTCHCKHIASSNDSIDSDEIIF